MGVPTFFSVHTYGYSIDYGYFRRHDDVLKRLPCLQLKFQSSITIGMMANFSAQRACTRKSHMASDSHDDGFQHPTYLCCIFLKISHDDDLMVLKKCCIIWAEFLSDANNTLQSRLIFVDIIFIFCRFDAASWPPDTLIPFRSLLCRIHSIL